jgi:hypothetical protein
VHTEYFNWIVWIGKHCILGGIVFMTIFNSINRLIWWLQFGFDNTVIVTMMMKNVQLFNLNGFISLSLP